jgi:hypothetical protein
VPSGSATGTGAACPAGRLRVVEVGPGGDDDQPRYGPSQGSAHARGCHWASPCHPRRAPAAAGPDATPPLDGGPAHNDRRPRGRSAWRRWQGSASRQPPRRRRPARAAATGGQGPLVARLGGAGPSCYLVTCRAFIRLQGGYSKAREARNEKGTSDPGAVLARPCWPWRGLAGPGAALLALARPCWPWRSWRDAARARRMTWAGQKRQGRRAVPSGST